MNIAKLQQEARSEGFRQYLVDLLVELCRVDTTARADVAAYRAAEDEALRIVERHLRKLQWPGLGLRRVPINPAIAAHPFYSIPYYTARPTGAGAIPVVEAYAGRSNLVATVEGAGGGGTALAFNAHVDVVPPYIPPRVEGGRVHGRGACDDKGPLVCLLGAMKLVRGAGGAGAVELANSLTAMFVIEEETGGNGSLSLALDRELRRRYDTLMVLECCSSQIHPGNRGALWYKVEARLAGANLFEASAFIIEEIEWEGLALRAESRHDLFPHRPVQTCHGILGHWGEHPSRICGRVEFEIRFKGVVPTPPVRAMIEDVLAEGLRQYVGWYGDKTQVNDPATGKPKVERHYDLTEPAAGCYQVAVHGSTGHMGSILQNDGAITKLAALVRSLVASRAALERMAGASMELALAGWADVSHLVMEGGQGFLPTHPMSEVQERLRQAVWRGAARYLGRMGRNDAASPVFQVSFDKLHNAAFAGRPDSPAMSDAIAAARASGIWDDGPVRGWDVSCDARLFATEHPDLTVLTSGPGHLAHAHADHEQIEIAEMVRFTEFLALFILQHVGTAPRPHQESPGRPGGKAT
ncbi:MAG: M20/M25/M40 family metallo-hydrolase [Verrucomicrobia bacterium]|jgi:acetylornithine deacetylase/succinyl-diaminopimelate desuccinylase-like protein|nr:M20/M25/M40 family metallo-hydrolase [Verrucomicrobiota bacterium]